MAARCITPQARRYVRQRGSLRTPRCPRCGYDQRRLPEARCPECGLTYDAQGLRQAARTFRRGQWFETAWRRRPLAAWWWTTSRAAWPPTFWRAFPLAAPIEPRGLALTWLAVTMSFPLCFVLIGGALWLGAAVWTAPMLAGSAILEPELLTVLSRRDRFWECMITPLRPRSSCWILLRNFQGFAIGLWLALWLLRETMSRGGVRALQLARVVTYSSIAAVPLFGVLCVAESALIDLRWTGGALGALRNWMVLLALPTALLVWSLACALKYYLRLPRAWWIASALTAIGCLVVTILFIWAWLFGW